MKKIISLSLVTLLFLFSFGGLCAFADDESQTETEAPQKMKYVVLGDSIAEGVGADFFGIISGYKNGFANKVVDKKGYELKNHAASATTSDDLLYAVKNNEGIQNDIKTADVISISIGGNDVMGDNLLSVAVNTLIDRPEKVDDIVGNLRFNHMVIIDRIRQLNPDAVIFVQNLYNPMGDPLKDTYQKVIKKVNVVFSEYLEKNPSAYYLLDLEAAFKGESDYIAWDLTHPSKKGHVKIAEMIILQLDTLEQQGKLKASGKNQFVEESSTVSGSDVSTTVSTTASTTASGGDTTGQAQSIPKTGDSDRANLLFLLLPAFFIAARAVTIKSKKQKASEA